MNLMRLVLSCVIVLQAFISSVQAEDMKAQCITAMKKEAENFRDKAGRHGGYVYITSLDGKDWRGETKAEPQEIWVQPPGTPAVGLAYLDAYAATHDDWYLEAAITAGKALAYGQLKSGGWTYSIDFNPTGPNVNNYWKGKGDPKGKNISTLDDDTTQSALLFLMTLDQATQFKNPEFHEAVQYGLKNLYTAQFPNGAFSQGWRYPAEALPVIPASYPDYDWKTEHRVKAYWNLYTLNDNLAGDMVAMLIKTHQIYQDNESLNCLKKLGDFLILAQMPAPQPAWAQQYTPTMQPAWARKFEPPAITASESQDVILALMKIAQYTGEEKYLQPIPAALDFLETCVLSDGQLARFYELKTNKPLYMTLNYELTYDDKNYPKHYSFKIDNKLPQLRELYVKAAKAPLKYKDPKINKPSDDKVQAILNWQKTSGAWLVDSKKEPLAKGAPANPESTYLSSEVFVKNMKILTQYVRTQTP
jgi:PelA/Pel-15E family pectate lyase